MSAKYKLPLAELVEQAYMEGYEDGVVYEDMQEKEANWKNSEAKANLEKYLKGESQ